MFVPSGFGTELLKSSLGQIAYYTAEGTLWQQSQATSETLVFLHALGGGSSAYEWSKVYPAFAADYRILAPDLIGWGRSDHPTRDYRPEDYVQMIVEFIKQTCDRPVTVIASGLTAAFTIRAATESPSLFKSLILVTTAGLNDFGHNYSENLFAQIIRLPILDRFFYSAGVATPTGIRGFLEQRQFASLDRIYPEIIEAYLQSAQQPNAEYAALAFVRGDLSFDLAEYIPKLTTPTALIWGQKTEYTNPDLGRRFMQMNPIAIQSSEYLDDARLTPHLELPGIAIGLIRKYLALLNLGENQMVHTLQPTDLESTLNILQQDLMAADPAITIALIERWETQLQETHFFGKLSELKQAILEGRSSAIATLLEELGQATCATVSHLSDRGSNNVEMQVDQLGQALTQAGQVLHESLTEQR
ncbi:MAG: alpha/beta hydrolase [Leptolyngbya sp. Prado105]|jgi:pimeloyl-ACP methyl ester carboxylesterase|nr:alpha/beta hydrolase [Leptolyngbya sp. Prado105]